MVNSFAVEYKCTNALFAGSLFVTLIKWLAVKVQNLLSVSLLLEESATLIISGLRNIKKLQRQAL